MKDMVMDRIEKVHDWAKYAFCLGTGVNEVRYINYTSDSGMTVVLVLTDDVEDFDYYSEADLSLDNIDWHVFLCGYFSCIYGVPGVLIDMRRGLYDYLVSPDSGPNKHEILNKIVTMTEMDFPFTDWFSFTWSDV